MDFDWMNYELPQDIQERNAERREAQAKADARTRAALLRRLGYDDAYAKHRVLGNQEWAWEVIPGKPAASKVQLRAEVDGAFNR